MPPVPLPNNRFNSPATLEDKRARVRFGPGFEIITDDDEFIFQFHDLTQVDYRGYLQGGQPTVHDTFGLPRQWWMFSGHITKEFGYFVSFAEGFDTISGLDMFVDFNYDRRLQFRVGRFKTPFTYEFFVEPIQGLITPERSLFFNNFGQNRDVGIMAYGQLFNGPNFDQVSKVQYAAGIFNGLAERLPGQPGRQGLLGLRQLPSLRRLDGLAARELQRRRLGLRDGSTPSRIAADPLRTVVPTTGNAILGIPFLTLSNKFREQGPMAFWDLHAAYFYRQLALIGEWQSGYQDYAQFATQAEADQAHPRARAELLRPGRLPADRRDQEPGRRRQAEPPLLAPAGRVRARGLGTLRAATTTWTSARRSTTTGWPAPTGNANRLWRPTSASTGT